jgi:hypothetical protein
MNFEVESYDAPRYLVFVTSDEWLSPVFAWLELPVERAIV